MDEKEKEKVKRAVREQCCIFEEYTMKEMVLALVMKDEVKLQEMRDREVLLKSHVAQFEERIDGPDEQDAGIALRTFKKPEKQ